MAATTFEVPSGTLTWNPPNELVTEKDKTPQWFGNYARWIVSTFYNQPTGSALGINNATNLNNFGFVDNVVDNWRYMFCKQENRDFNYVTTNFNNVTLPAVWVNGGKIPQLIDHLGGVILESIENIEVTAINLSDDALKTKQMIGDKLTMELELRDLINQTLPPGVKFQPVNDPNLDIQDTDDIEQYKESWQDQYAIIAEKIGENQLLQDNLKVKFQRAAIEQFVGGISSIMPEVIGGHVINTVIPAYERIWDNRADDPFGADAMFCGFVKHNAPYLEIIQKFKDQLSEDDIDEMQQLASSEQGKAQAWFNYYNTGMGCGNRYSWWAKDNVGNMTLSYATIYFIAPRTFPFKKMRNRFGNVRVSKLEGAEVSGDWSGFDLHQVTLIGNKYIVNEGYAPNVLRKFDNKGKIRLPILSYTANYSMGFAKALVSDLRPHQNEIDRLSYLIQRETSQSHGKKYYINGNKLGNTNAVQFINDLTSIGIHVGTGGSGEIDDPTANQRTVELIDMTLDPGLNMLLNLKAEQKLEMEERVSVSRIALGQQANTVGKGVQQNTINQNSYGTAQLMYGLMKFFNDVLQYNVDLKQLLYSKSDTVEEGLLIGDAGSELLKILNPREFGTQPLLVYMQNNSVLDPAQREAIRTIALSQAQNGGLDLVDFIENIYLAKTVNQTVRGLKRAKNKQVREEAKKVQAQMQAEQAFEAAETEKTIYGEGVLIQLKELNANFREAMKVAATNPQVAQAFAEMQPTMEQVLATMQPPAPEGQEQPLTTNQ
jgi:hypothetical protein